MLKEELYLNDKVTDLTRYKRYQAVLKFITKRGKTYLEYMCTETLRQGRIKSCGISPRIVQQSLCF